MARCALCGARKEQLLPADRDQAPHHLEALLRRALWLGLGGGGIVDELAHLAQGLAAPVGKVGDFF